MVGNEIPLMEQTRKPVRVLHIVGSLHPGGMENFVMNLCENMDSEKVMSDILVHMRREDDQKYVECIEKNGGHVYELPRLTRKPLTNLHGITELVQENHYAVVIRHTPNALIAPQLWAAKRGGARVICHSHTETDPKKVLHFLGKIWIKHMDVERFACSPRAGQWMFGKKTFHIIHNAVNLDKFTFSERKREQIRKELHVSDDTHIYGHVANFIACKNHQYLIRIFQKILEQDENGICLCIGDGELRPQIEEEAKKLKIADKVIFMGVRHDADALMAAMDVMIFPSLFEGLPLTLIEAQAAGLPILLSDTVTKEVEVTDGLITWLTIQSEPEKWADAAIAKTKSTNSRECQRQKLITAGYDIRTLSVWYENFFSQCASE